MPPPRLFLVLHGSVQTRRVSVRDRQDSGCHTGSRGHHRYGRDSLGPLRETPQGQRFSCPSGLWGAHFGLCLSGEDMMWTPPCPHPLQWHEEMISPGRTDLMSWEPWTFFL